ALAIHDHDAVRSGLQQVAEVDLRQRLLRPSRFRVRVPSGRSKFRVQSYPTDKYAPSTLWCRRAESIVQKTRRRNACRRFRGRKLQHDVIDGVGEASFHLAAASVEDVEHVAVVAQDVGGEAGDAVRGGELHQGGEQEGADAAALELVGD